MASELTKQQLEVVSDWKWNKADMEQREKDGADVAFVNECIQKVYADLSMIKVVVTDIVVKDNMELDLGDIQLELYARDSIHSRDALLVYIPKEKALFVGDADGEDIYNNDEVKLSRLKDYRQFINQFDFQRYFMGHDFPDSQRPRCKQWGIKQDTLQSSGVFDPRGSRQMRASSRLARCFAGIK